VKKLVNTVCPLCGGEMVAREGNYPLRLPEVNERICGLEWIECTKCDERFFDHIAMTRLEAAVRTLYEKARIKSAVEKGRIR